MAFNQTLKSKLKANFKSCRILPNICESEWCWRRIMFKKYFKFICLQSFQAISPHLRLWVTILIICSKLMQCVSHNMFTFINNISLVTLFLPALAVAEYVSFCTKQSSVFNADMDFISRNQTVAEIRPVTIHPRWILVCWCVFLFWFWDFMLKVQKTVHLNVTFNVDCGVWWTFTLDCCVVLFASQETNCTKIRPRKLSTECTLLVMLSRNQTQQVTSNPRIRLPFFAFFHYFSTTCYQTL